MGCRVCGAGIDYSWGPEWVAILPGTYLISTQLYWNVFEYLCLSCHSWAEQHEVLWDGKLTFGFTGWRVKPNGDIAGMIRLPLPRIHTKVLV